MEILPKFNTEVTYEKCLQASVCRCEWGGVASGVGRGIASAGRGSREEYGGGASGAACRRIDEQRARQAEATPLHWQRDLGAAARWLAQDMAEKGYFDHTDPQGRSIAPRLPDFGYKGYSEIGENIAAGQPTPEAVVEGWMHSPGHRANILNPAFREIGVGYFSRPKSRYRRFWVQDFGSRFDIYPVVINGEAAQASSVNVRLTIYGKGWAQRMRLSNDGMNWTAWEKYRSERDWTLEPGSGKRTVFVELSDEETTRRAEDSIELVTKESGK